MVVASPTFRMERQVEAMAHSSFRTPVEQEPAETPGGAPPVATPVDIVAKLRPLVRLLARAAAAEVIRSAARDRAPGEPERSA
jgi:hypothetical protein